MKRFASIAVIAALAGLTLRAQDNWTQVGQDPGHSKYSTLDQINTGNVTKLQRAWTFHTGDKSGFFESTPMMVNSVMSVSYTHLRAHETGRNLVCRLLLE